MATIKEKIARNAASEWCRCFKCDGIVMPSCSKCEKEKKLTCHKWYDGYRTALLALEDDRVIIKEEITMATITEDYVSFEVAKLLREKGFKESTFILIHYRYETPDGINSGELSNIVKVDGGKFYLHELQHALRLCGILKEIEL